MSNRSIVLLAITLALGETAEGQVFMSERESEHRHRYGTWLIDLGPQYARPIGEFRANVERAWGFGASVRYGIDQIAPLGLRLDGAFFNYGNERKEVMLSPTVNRVHVDMNTSNNIAMITGGPELAVRTGAIRPYVFAFAGFSYLFTESSVGDDGDGDGSFASTTNFDDGGWATGWGGGLRLPLNVRRRDVAIDVGARMTRNGTRSYLRRGDIIDQPDGSLQFIERRTNVEFLQYQLGVSFAPSRSRRR
jgi:hypothetical protein